MSVLLEVIPAAVGGHSRVEHVDFTDRPPVETAFREDLFEQAFVPDLNVPYAQTKPPNSAGGWQRSGISVVHNPPDRSNPSVDSWHSDEIHFSEWVEFATHKRDACTVRTSDRLLQTRHRNLQITELHVLGKMLPDLGCMTK